MSTTTFDEAKHVRDDSGRFDEKQQTAPEVSLAPLSAAESSRRRVRAAIEAGEAETAQDIRRLGRRIPGAHRILFVDGDDNDESEYGDHLQFSHAEDADGDAVDISDEQYSELLWLGREIDPRGRLKCFDGHDTGEHWIYVYDEDSLGGAR